jgi:hypothetical protein
MQRGASDYACIGTILTCTEQLLLMQVFGGAKVVMHD